jgi:hypothetical protein
MVVPPTCLRTDGVLQAQAGVPGGNFSVVREKIRGGIARASDPLFDQAGRRRATWFATSLSGCPMA